MGRKEPKLGDYVLATKYNDGDPQDQWAVGWLHPGPRRPHDKRYHVADADDKFFRASGFRRAQAISFDLGEWLVTHAQKIELGSRFSMWGLARMSKKRRDELFAPTETPPDA